MFVGNVIGKASRYLLEQYQSIIHGNDTSWQEEWPQNQPKIFKCGIIIHLQGKGIIRSVIEMYRTTKGKDFSSVIPGSSRSKRFDLWDAWNDENFCKIASDLFASTDGKRKPKIILIEGVSGIGKTMFVRQITSHWKNIEVLCKKKFVFFLDLWDPEVNKMYTMHDMTRYFLKPHIQPHEIKQVVKYIFETNGSCLTIIFDGYNEISLNSGRNPFFSDLMERKILNECLMVITSRPLECKELQYHACRRIELLGFNEDHREGYLSRAFQGFPHNYKQLKRHMQNIPSIDVLCCTPLNLTFLAYLLNCNSFNYLPVTKTEFFEKFTCYTFTYCLKLGVSDNLAQLGGTHGKIFRELGKFSFALLKEDKACFSLEDLVMNCPKYWSMMKPNPCSCGLLKKTQHFPVKTAYYSFLHLGIQEYLAANYLSQLGLFEDNYHRLNAIFDECFLKHRYINMWVLFFGIIKEQDGILSHFKFGNKLLQAIKHVNAKDIFPVIFHDQLKILQLFQCFKEAGNIEICSKIRDSLGYEINFSGHRMLPENIITLCFAITQSSEYCNLTTLDLTDCKIGDTGCTYFYQQLQYCLSYCNLTIYALVLSNNQLTPSSINQIIELTLALKIRVLDFSNNHFSDVEADKLVKNCHCLNFLNLVDNNINNADEQSKSIFYSINMSNFSIAFTRECLVFQPDKINNVMAYSTSVKILFMDCTEAGYDQQIRQFLQKATSLKVLHLRTQSSFDTRMLNLHNIKELYVSQLSDEDADCCIRMLSKKSDSIIMVMSKSKFYARNVRNAKLLNFALAKCKTQSICKINIRSCNFDIRHLAIALASKTNFTFVIIGDCDIGENEIKCLYGEQRCTTVNEFYLSSDNLQSVECLKKLVACWQVKILYINIKPLSFSCIQEITSYIKSEHLELEILYIQNCDCSVNELNDICENLFVDPKYTVDLSVINVSSVIVKKSTEQNIYSIIDHLSESRYLKLYITEKNIQSNCLSFDYLSHIAYDEGIMLQKLFLDTKLVNIEILYSILKKGIQCLYLCASDNALPDEKSDDILKNYCENIPVCILSESKVQARSFIFNIPITICTQNITSLSFVHCIFSENILALLVKILITYARELSVLDLSHCKLGDSGINLIWSQLKRAYIFSSIKTLHLSGNEISHYSVAYLIGIVSVWKIKLFYASNNSLMGNGLQQFITYAMKSDNISYIELLENQATSIEGSWEKAYFSNKTQLSCMLTNNGIIIAKYFCDVSIQRKVTVERLYICNHNCEHALNFKHLSSIMYQSVQSLKSLYVINHQGRTVCAEEIQLHIFPKLCQVYIEITALLDIVANQLINNCKIAGIPAVIISRSTFTAFRATEDMILQVLNFCCKTTAAVTTIKMTKCIVEKIVKNIGATISNCNKTWEVVCLKNCDISDRHIQILAEIVTSKATVVKLDLSSNKLTSSSFKHLGKIVHMWKTEVLSIEENGLSSDIIYDFSNFIESSQIQYLFMQNNTQLANSSGRILCETMIFNDDCKLKFAQITEDITFINGSTIDSHFETTKQNEECSIYFKFNFHVFQQEKYSNAVKQFEYLFMSLHILKYLFIVITDKEYLYEQFLNVIVENIGKIQNLLICAESMHDDMFTNFMRFCNKSSSSAIIGILSQNNLIFANAGEKVLNHILDYKCFHGKNVNNIFLIGCKISQKSISLLVKSLKCTCRNIEQLTLWECELEDAHVYCFQNALKQQESNRLTVTRLDLSDNCLKSPDVIELACLLRIQELWLTNNQLQIQDTAMITEMLADENCHANYIDLQNNLIINVEDVCKKLFFVKDFNFNLIGVGHGCIITKRLHFKIQHGMRVNSLFFAFIKALTDQDFQDVFQIVNSLINVTVKRLYIAMLQHKSWYRISEKIKFLTVTDELYLCVPDMDITNLEFFWQYKCKSKLILSREGLKALHIEDSEILCKTLGYVTVNSKAIVLESSNVCYTTINKLAKVLSNNGNDKRWESFKLYNCSISDDHIWYFYETLSRCKKHGKILIQSVNLSKNKISQYGMGMINQLLEEWKTEQLMIAENDLQHNGILQIIQNDNVFMHLRVLDTHQNNVLYTNEEISQLWCKDFLFNKELTFIRLTNSELIVDGSAFTDLSHHELISKTDVSSVYLKFSTIKQDRSLSNIEKCLLSLGSLDHMFIAMFGSNIVNNKILKLLKKVNITKALIIWAENMPESSFKLVSKLFEPNCTLCVSSRQRLYIANSDDKMFKQLLNCLSINRSCESIISISLMSCNSIRNDSIKVLAKDLINANRKEREIHLLEINNSSLVHTHIHEFCTTLTDNLTSITSTIKVLDLSNNYLDTSCMEDLIQVVNILHIEELLLNNNQLQEDGMKRIMDVLTDSKGYLSYIDLQNNCINDMENYFEKVFFFYDFSFSIITTNSVITTDGGCIITRSRLSSLKMQHAKVNCLYLAIRDVLADPDLQELSQTLAPPTRVNRLYIAVLQSASLYHVLKTIEHLSVLVSEELYLCIPEMDSTIADRLWKHQCKSKLILSRKMLLAENVKDSKVIFKTLDYVNADLEVIAIDESSLCNETIAKTATVLSNSNIMIWQSLKLCGCNITDDHVKHFYKEFIDSKIRGKVQIKYVNLSNNKITSSGLEMIVKLVKQWQSEELLMAGNTIQYDGLRTLFGLIATKEEMHVNNNQIQESDIDAMDNLEPLKSCLKCVDLQNNQIQNADVLCKKYFFVANCNFIFITTKDGIIITKELSFSVQPKQNINSFYVAIREVLPEKSLQNLLQLMNTLPKVVKNLYISMLLHNQSVSHLFQAVKCIEVVNEGLYLCTPEMDTSSVSIFWQHQCKSKLILSKQSLRATHIHQTEILFKTINCVTMDLIIISLENCDLSHTIMKKLAIVISNDGNDKTWNSFKLCNCNITDNHVLCFYEQFIQCKRQGNIQVNSVNLSSNNISATEISKIINLLRLWKSEELIITRNSIQYSGVLQLVDSKHMNIQTLDLKQNNVQPCSNEDIRQMCEEKTFNCSFNFKFAHLTKEVLLMDASLFNNPHYPVVDGRSDISSIYIKSTFSAPNLEENIQNFVSSFRYLENLFVVMQGNAVFSDCFVKILKDIELIKQFTLYTESMSDITYEKFSEPNNLTAILLRQKLYINNSDDKALNKMLSNTIHHCENMTNISINKCNMNSRSFELLAEGLISTSKKVSDISIDNCEVEDKHIEKLYETLASSYKQVTAENLTVTKLKLPHNRLKSLCEIKLVHMLQLKELDLNNNSIQGNDIIYILEALRNKNCHLKCVNLQNNCMSGLDDLCKRYFFLFEFNFVIITTTNGIIITKELLFNVQHKEDINSFYLAIREVLPEECLQNLLQLMNTLPKIVKNLYISMLHSKSFSRLIQVAKCVKAVNEGLYLCAPETDSKSANVFWQYKCKSKLILSKHSLQATHIDQTEMLFKTINCVTMDLIFISLENCDLSHAIMKKLAIVTSNDGNDKTWNSFKLCNCNITDDHVLCFYEQFIQCKRQGNIQVNSVNLSNNNVSTTGISKIVILLELWKSEELIITGSYLQYDGLESLIRAITNECNSLCLQTLDVRVNDVQCSREQITQLCELVVFNNNCNITNAKIQDFLILDGNCLDNNTNVTDATSICFIGNISASKQMAFLTNVQRLLLPFKMWFFENLYFLMSGELSLDKSFFNVLKQITIARKLVVNIKSIPGRSYMDAFVNQFESNVILGILSEQNLYISNSDDKLLHYMLNYMHQYYRNVTWVSINRCTMNKDSQSLDLLVKAMINNDKSIKCLALTNCEIGCNEIVALQSNMAIYHEQYECSNFIIKRIDLSNNCIDSQCGKSLIELANMFETKEMILNNNRLPKDDVVTFMNHLNDKKCSLKFIDCQKNCLEKLDKICETYFLNHHFDFGFFITKDGIVLTKSSSYLKRKRKISDVNFVYLRKTTTLSSNQFHGLMSYVNLGKQLNKLYMALHQNENLHFAEKDFLFSTALSQSENLYIAAEDLKVLLPTRGLHVFVPEVNEASIIWQHDCQRKLVLSKEALQANTVTDKVVLHSVLDSSQVMKTITVITFLNCSLHSDDLLAKLAQTLSNSHDSKVFQKLEVCNCYITDNDLNYLYDRYTEYSNDKCVIVKCVNLSNNAITSSGVQIVINLLKSWRSEELIIIGNDLDFNGLQSLINATKKEINTLKMLDAQENNILYLDGDDLSKKLFLDSEFSICYFRITPRNTFTLEAFDSVVIKQMDVNNFAVQIDTNENKHINFKHCLFTDDITFGLLNCLQKLAIYLKKLCLVGPIAQQGLFSDILKQSYSIQELHLYVNNMPDAVQLQITENLPKSCNSMTILSAKSFKVKSSNCNYIKRGIQLVLLQTCNSLNDISFNNCKMDDETLHLLHEMVWNCKHNKIWKNIDLSNCGLGDKLRLFLKLPNNTLHEILVENINLSFNALNSTSVDLIANTVLSCKVKRLYINDNNIKNDGIEMFIKFLVSSSQSVDTLRLKVLRMENNCVEYPTAENFASIIQNIFYKRFFWLCMDHVLLIKKYNKTKITVPKVVCHSFKSLYIFNCNVNVIIGFEHILRNLEKIGICDNYTTSKYQLNAEDLIKNIQGQNSDISIVVILQQVLIAKNANSNMLHHMLQQIPSVKMMSFQYCKISYEILMQIIRLLQITKHLGELSFNTCDLDMENCEALLQLLAVVDSEVISINLSSNQIESHNDVKYIVDVCSHLKVRKLYLNDNNLEDSKIKYFAELLQDKQHMIESIDFRSNRACSMTEGEFLHISKCKLQVFIRTKTKIYYEDDLEQCTYSDDDNIKYLYFIKYMFTTEMCDKLLSYNYLKKIHLVGQLNMNAKELIKILQDIHTDELLVVANNFINNEVVALFNSAICPIVIADKDTILGKHCVNGELINTALLYSSSPYFKQIHFTNCDITEYIEEITSQLLKFYNTDWKCLTIDHCNVDDNACTRLVRVLCTAKTHIESINFSGNLLTSSSVEAISNIINNLKVSSLCLNNNKYSLEDVEHIFNAIMMTYNIEKLNFEQNEIDGLLLNDMIKNKFLSFEFDVYEFQYNCHILACSTPNQWHFYKFYIDSTESITNVSYIYNSQLQIEKIYVNAKTLQSLETFENDVYFLSKKISEVCIINKSTLSDFNKQQLNKEAILNIKLILSSKFVTTLELLQTQGNIDLPCLTILVSHKCGNPEGLVSKSISLMPEISLVHILVLPFSDVNNEIEKILLDLTNITSIRLFEMHIKKELKIHSALICKLLTNAKDLEALNMSHNNLESPEIAHISTGIKNNSSLRSINFSCNNITVNDRETLMIALMNKSNIKEINISNNPIYYLELRMITKLTTLDLSYTYLGIDDDENIKNLKEIMDNNVNLKVLNLSGNNIGDKMKLLIVPPLQNKSLRCFNISDNEITYREAVCILNIIQENPLLQEFDISHNPLSSKHVSKCGITIILKGLQTAEIKKLDLSYTEIANTATVNNLSKAFKRFNTLENISISGFKRNISTILRAMEGITSLKALFLEKCNVSCKDADTISNIISQNANLQLLDVNKNKIEIEGFKSILCALLAHDVSRLKTLKVAENNIVLEKPLYIVGRMPNAKLHLDHLDVSNKKMKVTAILYLLNHYIDVCSLKSLNICRSYDAKDHDIAGILNLLANCAKNLVCLDISGYRFISDRLQNFQDHIHLTHINISDCGITEDTADIMTKNNLLKFDTLNSLDLSNSGPATPILCRFVKNIHTIKLQRCNISVNNLDALLCCDTTICILHLCHNNLANKKQASSPFTNRLVQYLSNPVNKSLKELCLHSCELSTMDAAEIIKALKKNNTLKCLNLNNNHILYKPTLLNDVENSLRENSCLEQIWFIGNPMEARDIARLMIHCGRHSISINRMEFPLTMSEQVKEDIKKDVKSINMWRAKNNYVTPLHLVFLHNEYLEH